MKTIAAALLLSVTFITRTVHAESFVVWAAKGEKAEKKKDAPAALEAYTNALRLWRKGDGKKAKAKVLAARGALLAAAGSADAALKDLADAVKNDDKSAPIFLRKGRVELDQNKLSDAISDFYKATKLNLNYKEAYFYRGYAYERQGDAQFAREDYKTACRLGLKAACSEAARAKAQAALAAGAPDAFEAATAAPERRTVQVGAKKKRKAPSYKLDWKGCLDTLNNCVEAGGAYGECVKQAPVCETKPGAGCCPQDCVKKYNETVDQGAEGSSEADAFRQIFDETGACVKP